MSVKEIHAIELAKWNAHAAGRDDESLRVTDEDFAAYCRRVSTMDGIAEFLGDLRGKRVLDMGCGFGHMTVLLARSGAEVSAVDLSPQSLSVAERRARLHDVRASFHAAPGERLPFPDATFDVVVGKAILHHLEVDRAGPELYRVLRPGGRAAFSEPLGTNRALVFARDHVPYPRKNPRGGDVPLTAEDLVAWESHFDRAVHRELALTTMLARAVGVSPAPPALRRLDARLLARFPRLRPLCRYVVLTMQRA